MSEPGAKGGRKAGEGTLHYGLRMEASAEAWYLERHPGARCLARNFRSKVGEIDLIFEEPLEGRLGRPAKGLELVFVEVRARLEGSWLDGLESVTPVKQRRLVRIIGVYLARYRGPARSARLDVLAWDGQAWRHARDLRGLAGQA